MMITAIMAMRVSGEGRVRVVVLRLVVHVCVVCRLT